MAAELGRRAAGCSGLSRHHPPSSCCAQQRRPATRRRGGRCHLAAGARRRAGLPIQHSRRPGNISLAGLCELASGFPGGVLPSRCSLTAHGRCLSLVFHHLPSLSVCLSRVLSPPSFAETVPFLVVLHCRAPSTSSRRCSRPRSCRCARPPPAAAARAR